MCQRHDLSRAKFCQSGVDEAWDRDNPYGHKVRHQANSVIVHNGHASRVFFYIKNARVANGVVKPSWLPLLKWYTWQLPGLVQLLLIPKDSERNKVCEWTHQGHNMDKWMVAHPVRQLSLVLYWCQKRRKRDESQASAGEECALPLARARLLFASVRQKYAKQNTPVLQANKS